MVAKFLDHNNRESFNGDGEQQKTIGLGLVYMEVGYPR